MKLSQLMKENRLIDIIKEEIENIIISEYEEDEIIDFDKINLQQEFDKLNAQLFNGEVPRVPMKWSKRKTALGHVKSKVQRDRLTGRRELLNMELWMSIFFAVTYRQFLNTLAHEMIHVKLNSEDIRYAFDPHGWRFMEEARKINDMGLGFNITQRNGEDLPISDKMMSKLEGKQRIAIVLNLDGNYSITTTSPSVYQNEFEDLINTLQYVIDRGKFNKVEVNAIESANPKLAALRQSRTFRRGFSHSPLSDDLLEELLEDNIIKTVTLEKGKERMVAEELMTQ